MILDRDDPLSGPPLSIAQEQQLQLIPSLEELVDACCLTTITHQEQTQFTPPLTPTNFHNYIFKYHCEENLEFLIQIYRYEFIWNQLFKRRSSILKCKKQISNTGSMLQQQQQQQKSSIHSSSIHRTNTNATSSSSKILIDKIDLKTNKDDDISSFVNLKLNSSSKSVNDKPDSWNDFDHLNNNTSTTTITTRLSDDEDCLLCNDQEIKDDADPHIREDLLAQWNKIISNYIKNNSPYQINLPSEIYSNILKNSNDQQILYHSPEILIGAKNFVLQLLRENIYEDFLQYYNKKPIPLQDSNSSNNNNNNNNDNNNGNNTISTTTSLNASRIVDMTSLKHQFDKYEQKSLTSESSLTTTATTSRSSSQSSRPKLKKLHTVTNILPIVRGHTFHLSNNEEIPVISRGPCNVRVSEYSLYHHHDDGLTKIRSQGGQHDEEHHKKGWVRKLLKH